MIHTSGKQFRRAAALIALPLIALTAPALAQDASSSSSAPATGSEARPIRSLLGPVDPRVGNIRTFRGPVDPQVGNIRTFEGNVNARVGNIRTFEGDVSASVGNIRTFDGEVDPSVGNIRTFTGEVDASVGNIRTFTGDLTPYVGNIRTFVGNIRTFEGQIDPAVGNIRTFEGDIDPYVGNIRTFWGSLTPKAGALDPMVGNIRTFSDAFLPQSGTVLTTWAQSQASGDYAALAQQLRQLEKDGAAIWGKAVATQTGKSFAAGFSDAFFARWGVDLSNPQSLAGWDVIDRERLLLDWYDNVLLYSGMDSADHWMNTINWTPKLTQTQGGGSDAVIGLVDFYAADDADLASKTVYWGGYTDVVHPHGAAVGSLIVASHDGRGVMGIAPDAKVAAYNPFDETLTASWEDVTTGIVEVGLRGASVINLSLGVPGSALAPDWQGVFQTAAVEAQKDRTIYVIAAGNDGVAQASDVEMGGALDSTFLVVGSVDPYGRISSFSNTPGMACLTVEGTCDNIAAWNEADARFDSGDYLAEGGLLMNRFLVAPGELILVSDGQGGVTRMSGTSFAAPLVSGTIALLQDRWPWLKNHPRDVARIVLESAQDMGAPGVDAVYGHGLLDVEAAQSPLDFAKLTYYEPSGKKFREVSASTLLKKGVSASWSARDLYFIAFEQLDSTERDFLIPLSSRLFDTSLGGVSFQDHVYHRMVDWMSSASFAGRLTDAAAIPAARLANGWGLTMRGRTEPVAVNGGERMALRTSVELTNPVGTVALAFGSGDGALALAGSGALAMNGDYDPRSGGANPLLGFASGGAHAATRVALGRSLDLSFGVTQQDRSIEQYLAAAGPGFADAELLRSAGDAQAQATMAKLAWRPGAALNLSLSYTRLAEEGAFFGVRSLAAEDFGEATVSDGLTLAGDADLGDGLSLFATGTASRSRSVGNATLGIDGALGTAFQLGVAKQGLFAGHDSLRLSLAQPLTVESGSAELSVIGVVDRETGEKGLVTQRVSIGAPDQRRHRVEALYGTPMLQGMGTLGLFGSAELHGATEGVPAFTAGGNVKFAF